MDFDRKTQFTRQARFLLKDGVEPAQVRKVLIACGATRKEAATALATARHMLGESFPEFLAPAAIGLGITLFGVFAIRLAPHVHALGPLMWMFGLGAIGVALPYFWSAFVEAVEHVRGKQDTTIGPND